ncbi:hypothetical protein KRR40_24260 [Niabella defluvii]|nr:hypothetical protein KRR40_24260 [Niabella sp. I65]
MLYARETDRNGRVMYRIAGKNGELRNDVEYEDDYNGPVDRDKAYNDDRWKNR